MFLSNVLACTVYCSACTLAAHSDATLHSRVLVTTRTSVQANTHLRTVRALCVLPDRVDTSLIHIAR